MEGVFAVVPEGWVAQVVREAGDVDEVGVAPEGAANLPADLGYLKGVGEPGARKIELTRGLHLGFGRKPSKPGRVQHARPVAGEGGACGGLGGLDDEALLVDIAVSGGSHCTRGYREGLSPRWPTAAGVCREGSPDSPSWVMNLQCISGISSMRASVVGCHGRHFSRPCAAACR
ncbi:unannotated protein [freshwater metagenome]|uniref:Unannotated protein n=1 Tax=freshwater metagenome TaxID=449393 RepID=A0A6J7RDR4_9ZZZZ